MKQRARLPVLQVFLHLPGATTSEGSKLGAALVAGLSACAAVLAAVLSACLATLAAGSAGAATPALSCPDANLRPTATDVPTINAATLCLVNRLRAAHGMRPLRSNRELGHVAASQVNSMVRWNYFADIRPSGQTPLSLVAVTRYPAHAASFAVGQNIAWGTGGLMTPTRIVAEWMASRPHREIMLSGEYRDAGVAVTPTVPAVLHAGSPGATYAIEFGVRF